MLHIVHFPIERYFKYGTDRCIGLGNSELVQLSLEACECTKGTFYPELMI
jgi:hypothetical protein